MGLTRHATTMDLVIQFPGDGVVPWQRFGPCSQFLVGASLKQGAETFVAHRQMMENLQHIKQDRDGYRVQDNGLERTHHLETA